jgi:hypothetical protein
LEGSARREPERIREGWLQELHAGRRQVVKERKSETELRQMMLAAARKHEECSELEDLFIFGPTPRPDAKTPDLYRIRSTDLGGFSLSRAIVDPSELQDNEVGAARPSMLNRSRCAPSNDIDTTAAFSLLFRRKMNAGELE